MGLFDKIKDIMTEDADDFDDFYDNADDGLKPPRRRRKEAEPTPIIEREEKSDFSSRRQKNDKVVNIHTTAQLQVVLVKPEVFEEAASIADNLNARRTVVLNLESASRDIARRFLDFLSGVAYANNGQIKRVANSTYIITPYNVDVMGDLIDELENNGMFGN